jgi:4-amino-4-deoxy-L-arabinose transferase-like glycosyltransferase
VIWVAALPELLSFFFVMAALVSWIRWLDTRRLSWGLLSSAAFLLGLLSKESAAVFPACALIIWFLEAWQWRLPLAAAGAMLCTVGLYAAAIFAAKGHHLHLNDGTFTLQAGFLWTLLHSMLRLIWPWGAAAMALLWFCGWRRWRHQIAGVAVWITIALLPYSFLTYMDRVPSRHTYLASAGIAILMGCAWQTLERVSLMNRPALTALAVAVILIHNLGYLWTKKFDQYLRRVEPTERFLRYAARTTGPVRIECAPYGYEVFRHAANIRLGWSYDQVLGPHEAPPQGEAKNYCDTSKP